MNTNLLQLIFAVPLIITIFWHSGDFQQTNKPIKGEMKNTNRVASSTWGTGGIGLRVADEGVSVEFDCAHGTINEPLVVDANGRFDAMGTYVTERPGPVREDRQPAAQQARYSGQVEGETMTVTIRLEDTKQNIGTFTLTRNKYPRLRKCL